MSCDVRTREAGIQVYVESLIYPLLVVIVADFNYIDCTTVDIHHKIKPEEVELVRRDYTANEGWETFLSYEGGYTAGYPGWTFTTPEMLGNVLLYENSMCMELLFPSMVGMLISCNIKVMVHTVVLMEEAERIAHREHRSSKIAVISGVGTRHYYRKLGYELEGPYMVKYIS